MTSFLESRLRVRADTAERMIRDCVSQAPRPGFRQLEILEKRIAKNLGLWAGRIIKYGRHMKSCPEGPGHQTGICNCGFREMKREAQMLIKAAS